MGNSELINIENRIFTIRGVQVMIDRDLAEMYQVGTKVLNQSVKRNKERFPAMFHFQLSDKEKHELVTNCDRFESLKHSTVNPYVFTEQGVIDETELYHFGASLKDMGKKWFAFSKMDPQTPGMLSRIKNLKMNK